MRSPPPGLAAAAIGMVALATSAAAEATPPHPSSVHVFGNWAVACDNGLRCEAVSMQPEEFETAETGLVVTREAGPDAAVTVTLAHRSTGDRGAAASIAVDGRIIAAGGLDGESELKTNPGLARLVIAALATGRRLRLAGDDDVSETSLDGAATAFRFMDDQQGRTGGVTALVAKGPLPASIVPKGGIPTIAALRGRAAAPVVPNALKGDLWSRSQCDGPVGAGQDFETHGLPGGGTLVLVWCGEASSYNRRRVPYVVRGTTVAMAAFDVPFGMAEESAPPQVVSGGWDDGTATLTSYERERGLGDCASQETFVWDGATFRLVAKDELDECRGGMRLLPVWRAMSSFRSASASARPAVPATAAGAASSPGVHANGASVDEFARSALHLIRYRRSLVDLDGDGTPEALVLTQDPDHCGSGGCDLYVLARKGPSWRTVTVASVTRAPIRVLPTSHHGWRDLAVRVAGGGVLPGNDVRLAFDGSTYPDNPTVPPATSIPHPEGATVIADAP